jgi:hypothetical protein
MLEKRMYKIMLMPLLVACGQLSVDYKLEEAGEETSIETEVVTVDTEEDTQEESEDTNTPPNYTGMIGGLVRFSSVQYGCYECFTDSVAPFSVSGVTVLHEPTFQTWNDWIPAPGTCTNYLTQNDPTDRFIDIGQKVDLNIGSRYLPFYRNYTDGTVRYDFSSTNQSDFQYNQPYHLNVYPNSNTDSFYVANILQVPDRITILSPSQLMNSMYTAFQPVVSKSGTTITWTPTGPGYFFVILDIYSSDGSTYLGGSLCVDNDDGDIYIDPSSLSSFYPGSLVAVYLHRYNLTETIHPLNGSTIQAISQVGLAGTATLNY